MLSSTSPCYNILGTEASHAESMDFKIKSIHYARSRSINDEQLMTIFKAWDGLDSSNSSTRCLPEAKRVLCLLTYPKCQEVVEDELEDEEEDEDDNNSEFHAARWVDRPVTSTVNELPVCQ